MVPFSAHAPGRLAAGAALPFRGLAYLGRNPELWRHVLIPVLLTVAGVVASLILAWPASAQLLGLVWQPPAGLTGLVWTFVHAVLFLVLVLLAAAGLPALLAAPFTDRLSARVEALELGAASSEGGMGRFLAETGQSLWHGARRVLVLAAGHLALLLLLVIPVIGAAYPVLAFLWSARWLALEYLDVPMARNLHPYSEVRAALRRVRPLSLGFGALLALGFLVPLAGFLMVPVGAIAGTLLYCDLIRDGIVPRRKAATAAPGPPLQSRLPRA